MTADELVKAFRAGKRVQCRLARRHRKSKQDLRWQDIYADDLPLEVIVNRELEFRIKPER
jgi:hypothetical protein